MHKRSSGILVLCFYVCTFFYLGSCGLCGSRPCGNSPIPADNFLARLDDLHKECERTYRRCAFIDITVVSDWKQRKPEILGDHYRLRANMFIPTANEAYEDVPNQIIGRRITFTTTNYAVSQERLIVVGGDDGNVNRRIHVTSDEIQRFRDLGREFFQVSDLNGLSLQQAHSMYWSSMQIPPPLRKQKWARITIEYGYQKLPGQVTDQNDRSWPGLPTRQQVFYKLGIARGYDLVNVATRPDSRPRVFYEQGRDFRYLHPLRPTIN